MSSEPTWTEAVRTAALRGIPAAVADLGALVRIPSVSWPSFDTAAVARSADAVADLLRGIGIFDEVSVSSAPIPGTDEQGMPAVLATRAARNGRPTVLLYAHHDVQPPGGDAEWRTPPFEPTVRDGRLYGRGAADDKAGIMLHIGALRALRDAASDIDLGLVVFIEGEEEYGSRSFGAFLDRHAEVLAADVIIVADSGNWDVRTPALTTSLRGNVRFTLRVRTLGHASHSGMFGGAVPDAMTATILLLSTLWDADGGVAVRRLATLEADAPGYDEAQLRGEAGLLDGVRPIGTGPILSRIWHGPAITVTGIDAPTVAAASNTLAAEVAVVVSARVAPGQPAADAFAAIEGHLRAAAPFGAHLAFEDVDLGEPFLVDTSGWIVGAARRALAAGYGVDPIDIGVGGSIPFVADLTARFPDAQVLITGIEDPDTRAHSPNESLHLETFRSALVSEAIVLADLHRGPVSGRTLSEEVPAAPRQTNEEKR